MFTKDKKVNDVYQTSNYGKFIFREHNRVIRPGHVKELAESMRLNGWEKGSYIVINEKGEIIDGQNRLLAAKVVGLPVHYTIEEGTGFTSIQNLNCNGLNWSKSDHVNGWVKRGNQNYIILENFMREYSDFRISEHLMFLQNSFTSILKNDFNRGLFVVNDVNLAKQWANNLRELKPYFEKYYNKSMFVRAMIRLLARKNDVFKFDEFLHKVKLRPTSIVPCGSVDHYIEMIENIYNFKRKDKVNLRF